jgi:hypothetical protein
MLDGTWQGWYRYNPGLSGWLHTLLAWRSQHPFTLDLETNEQSFSGTVRDQKVWGGLLPSSATVRGLWDAASGEMHFVKHYEQGGTPDIYYEGRVSGDYMGGHWRLRGKEGVVAGSWEARRMRPT